MLFNIFYKAILGTNVIATQIPLVLAYALTINKSQSLTLDKVNVDPDCFASGQLYTALSRVRNVEDVHLLRAIEKKDLIVDPRVQEFYEKIDADVNKCLPYEEYSHIVECIPLHLGLDEDFFPEPMVANY